MAKELPYFKFEPSEWDNGNIQMLSHEYKGLFIDLCAMYWARLGDLSIRLAVQKLCGGNATALQLLCDENIIALRDEKVRIKFLDEQLQEFENISQKNAENAKVGWEKRRSKAGSSDRNATAMRPHSERNAIREEKRREEKKKELPPNPLKGEMIDFEKLVDFINEKTGRSFKVVPDKVKRSYKILLVQGYTKDDILAAIKNAVSDDYHKETNFKYLTPEYFSRPKTIDQHSDVRGTKHEAAVEVTTNVKQL